MPDQETIPGQPVSETSQSEPDVAGSAQEQETLTNAGELESSEPIVPEKFRGKSFDEIARSYLELEKTLGRLGSEKSHREKEAEELRQRLAQREAELQQVQHYYSSVQQQPQQSPTHTQSDPLADFDEVFDENPREAVKQYVRKAVEYAQQAPLRAKLEAQTFAAQQHYSRLKQDNPDFSELEPAMTQLAYKYGKMLRPEAANSPEAIDLLYKIAKADNMSRYVEAEVKKKLSAVDLVKQEKRQAQVESATSSGSSHTLDYESMSLDELRRMLPRKDD